VGERKPSAYRSSRKIAAPANSASSRKWRASASSLAITVASGRSTTFCARAIAISTSSVVPLTVTLSQTAHELCDDAQDLDAC
jgi:hypothetical protein